MFSKKGFSILMLFLSGVFILPGCDSWLRKKSQIQSPQETLIVKTKELACLKEFPAQLNAYLVDQLETPSIHSMTDCVQNALTMFQKNTRGVEEKAYQSSELRSFFNRYFLKENKMSPEFMNEIMKLKVLFMGGSDTKLTYSELDKMHQYLEIIRSMALDLKGQWQMLLYKKGDGSFSPEHLSRTKEILQKSLRNFFKEAQLDKASYEWADIKSFLFQLDLFLGEQKTFDVLNKWMPFVESIKITFLGNRIIGQNLNDWIQQIEWASEAYFFSLEYFYFFKNSKYTVIKEYEGLFDYIERFLKLIEVSPQMAKYQFISLTAINRLIDEGFALKLFKTDLKPELFKSVVQKALWSFVEGKQAQSPSEILNLEMRHLKFIKNEFQKWKMVQSVYSDILKVANGQIIYSDFELALINYPIQVKIAEKTLSLTERSELFKNWEESLLVMTQVKHPLIWNSETHLIRDYNWKSSHIDYQGLTLTNMFRSITRLLLRGYGEGPKSDLWNTHLTEKGLIDLEEDFRDFGRSIGFLDYRQKNSARRTFKEANYFPILATRDAYLDSLEIFEMIHLLASGGRFISNPFMDQIALEKDINGQSCAMEDLDPFQKKVVYVHCFRESFAKNYPVILDGMPHMVRFLKSLTPAQFQSFTSDLLKISKSELQRFDLLDTGDLRTSITLLHYIENLMFLYDQNQGEVMDAYELYQASARFKGLVKLSPDQEKYWKEGFTYMVLYGTMPNSDNIDFKNKMFGIKTSEFFSSIGDWFSNLFSRKKSGESNGQLNPAEQLKIQKEVNALWGNKKANRSHILKTMIVLKQYVQ